MNDNAETITKITDLFNNKKAIEESNKTFTDNIVTARTQQGLSQEEFAEKLGTSVATIRKYEQGKGRKDAAYLISSLASALNVSADYLVGLSKSQHPDYNEITKKTGLNEHAIQTLIDLFKEDGNPEEQVEIIGFLNCFLGNGDCTKHFLQQLGSLARTKNLSSPTIKKRLVLDISDLLVNYLDKVVIPTYQELYETGKYQIVPFDEKYLSE